MWQSEKLMTWNVSVAVGHIHPTPHDPCMVPIATVVCKLTLHNYTDTYTVYITHFTTDSENYGTKCNKVCNWLGTEKPTVIYMYIKST